ncbi:hypothetical protein RIF29_18106 [Crotalaria pallida]|uniref:Uncharacterized protein n=1 Tax=Crotalaria pallida TaxID=3830 RepID=A0AAN9FIB4_CROPI
MEMEGKRLSSSHSESQSRRLLLLTKIKEFTVALVADLSNRRSPLILIPRFTNYCSYPHSNCLCGSDVASGKDLVLTLSNQSHLHRLRHSLLLSSFPTFPFSLFNFNLYYSNKPPPPPLLILILILIL